MGSRYSIIAVSAILMGLACVAGGLPILSFFGLFPILFMFFNPNSTIRLKSFFLYGWFFGTIYMLLLNYWMFSLHTWAPILAISGVWFLFSAFSGLYYGLTFLIARYLSRKVSLMIALPLAWTFGEVLRGVGPLRNLYGALGYAMTDFTWLTPLAYYMSVFALSFLVVLINVLLFKHFVLKFRMYISFGVMICILLGFNIHYSRIITPIDPTSEHTLDVAIVQAKHNQKDKLLRRNHFQLRRDYIQLINTIPKGQNIDLLLMPETITASYNQYDYKFMNTLKEFSQSNNSDVIFGTPTPLEGSIFNAAALISGPENLAYYHKQQLMPFGEYWPLKSLLTRLGLARLIPGSDFTPGIESNVLTGKNASVGTLICLESSYPNFSREMKSSGANILVVLANNGWFQDSAISITHLSMSRMRAIETGLPVLHAANLGPSAIIDKTGRILNSSKNGEKTILFGQVSAQNL